MMTTIRVSRSLLKTMTELLDVAAEECVAWELEESLTEDELIDLARDAQEHPGAMSLLQVIPMHVSFADAGLHELAQIGLSLDEPSVLNAIATLSKAPVDVLRTLRRSPYRSVRVHALLNLLSRSARCRSTAKDAP